MAPSVSGGGSGSGAPTTRSPVTSTTLAPWSCRPATRARYTASLLGGPQATLDHADETPFGQVVAGDGGLDVSRANQRRPCRRFHDEARRRRSCDEVVHERGHAFVLADSRRDMRESDPLGDAGERGDHRRSGHGLAHAELRGDRGEASLAQESEHENQPHLRRKSSKSALKVEAG